MRLRMLVVLCAALALAVGVVAGMGSAAPVSYVSCAFANGGLVTVPAGVDLAVRIGVSESTSGRMKSFLNDQVTTANIDGVPSDVSSLWSSPAPLAGSYVSFLDVPVGVLDLPGDAVFVTLQINLKRKHPGAKDPSTGKPLFSGPGDILPTAACRIVAV